MFGSPRARLWVGLLIVIVAFAIPVMVHLSEPEMQSDEAIYSYAVERILDTGNWLTPRSIPSDEPFLEKPPLKFWIVAAGIKSGLLPRDEAGLRFFDGLFGAIGFVYVYLLGVRLRGPVCGVVAVMALFTLDPLLFEHGLRSNNMEASVFLAYCGGVFHFARWVESTNATRRRLDAFAVAGFFVLGFMTKFVAALFLPPVCLLALLWRRGAIARVSSGWRDWLLPVTAVVVLTVPWFVYETHLFGRKFWSIIFGAHVYTRFTSSLDPTHVHVWHYYFTATWQEIRSADMAILAAAGFVLLAITAWRGTSWTARLVLVWAIVPMSLISIGTSKLLHYAYPFWPPIGLAVGLAFAWALSSLDGRLGAWITATAARWVPRRGGGWATESTIARRLLVAASAVFLLVALWTAVTGPMRYELGGYVVFRNSSVIRPIFFAVMLLWVAGVSRGLLKLGGVLALTFFLPTTAYPERIEHIVYRTNHPLRALRDCMAATQAAGAPRNGVLAASGNILHHSFYYYLWRRGPWTIAPAFSAQDVINRLTAADGPSPVIVQHADYDALMHSLPASQPALTKIVTHDAVRYDENIAFLLPGPYAGCVAPVLAAGGQPIWSSPDRGR